MTATMYRGYLPDLMRARADKDGLPSDHPVRIAANDMESIAIDRRARMYEVLQAALAARRIWRRYTGNHLYGDRVCMEIEVVDR